MHTTLKFHTGIATTPAPQTWLLVEVFLKMAVTPPPGGVHMGVSLGIV